VGPQIKAFRLTGQGGGLFMGILSGAHVHSFKQVAIGS
jgi:hypothetical protein